MMLSLAFVVAAALAAAPALAQESIKVGVLVSQSPPGSVIQGTEVSRGLEIMKDFINAGGGVLGRPIELLYEDSAGLPERGRSGAEKLITADNVVALTGGHQSSVVLAEIEVAHRYGVPYVNVNGWADAIRQPRYPEVFNPSPWNSLVSEAMARVIAGMGVKSVVTYAENTDYGIGQAEILGRMLEQLAPDVAYEFHVIDRQAADYVPVLLPLRRNLPEMVVTIALPPYGYRLVNQLYELGIAPSPRTWLFEGAGISDYPDFWSSVGPAAESMLALGFYHPDMQLTEMGDAVVAEYMRRHGGAPSRLVLQAADALLVIARAIEAAGSTDRQAVIQAMGEVAVEGTRGTMTFPQAEDPLFQQWTDIPYVVYQFTQVDQTLEKATLIMGPGQPLDVGKLQRP
ncbi:MAG TPA: ABC transporter substrate-binding protein [Limnochordales bacterium]|nr:ABC transporter substrate-binding protein [Limnochordales bacterium]